MPLEAAVAQATGLAAEGYREIVINGIEISSWGWEWKDGSCLRQLLAALCEAVPGVRIRLGSLEPRTIDEAFCKALSGYPNLCPQFHLSLQSGSDTVLKRMHRKYDTARYLESVRLLRQYFPGCAVTTDLIVGFPGGIPEDLRAFHVPHLPLLPPQWYACGGHARPDPERRQRAPRSSGSVCRSRTGSTVSYLHARHDAAGSV